MVPVSTKCQITPVCHIVSLDIPYPVCYIGTTKEEPRETQHRAQGTHRIYDSPPVIRVHRRNFRSQDFQLVGQGSKELVVVVVP